MEYNEDHAVKFMRENTKDTVDKKYSHDELINLIDIIWDYYEANGMLDFELEDDSDDDTLPSEEEELASLLAYATKMLARDRGAHILPQHIEPLIRAELAYERLVEQNI